MGNFFDPKHHSKTMRSVRSHNTKHEMVLRNYLAEAGFVEDPDESDLPFNPDIVFCRSKVAMFMQPMTLIWVARTRTNPGLMPPH